ncbi:HNH endonuclease [Flavobacterium sp. AG291]|uniref:HNH endonuclease n=1 Tax=Flavobacterium sp. AG291 TaxID=2184000 RepID=UPI000E0AE4D6|nr:HNH endonuclease [Flavobacterium sp. AG291]RDI05494.1 putative restriction endonuclease [Flavobacterium sp. AG291]
MFAISPTDKDWYNYLKQNQFNSYINFWTPTPWNISRLKEGNRLYFMLKSPIRKIGGFGEFVEYKNMTAEAAWNEFGYRNGRESKADFLNGIQKYIDKNSDKYGKRLLNSFSYQIGCIVLKNCQFWDEEYYKLPAEYNIEFANQVVTIKYYEEYDSFLQSDFENDSFDLVQEPRERKKQLTNIRNGQGAFKGKILKAYRNACCVTGETIPELLEAAHIQQYKSKTSNHVQNGLLLRVDIHRLFDNNLIFIDGDYVIHVSDLVGNEYYKRFDGKKITLPDIESEYPSTEALELKREEFRKEYGNSK